VKRIAAALRGLGIRKGDRVTIYMPTSAEAVMLMLATVRIGAIHSVVFAGFGANALGDRIAASGSKVLFTADVTYRKGKDVALTPIVEEALSVASSGGTSLEHVVVWERKGKAESARPEGDGRPKGLHYTSWTEFLKRGSRATSRRWKPTNRLTSWRRQEPRQNRSSPFTPTAATRSTSSAWASGASA
jgi:acetyl-CoA synthetase